MRENLAGRSYEGVVEPVKQAPHPPFSTVPPLSQGKCLIILNSFRGCTAGPSTTSGK